jgi:hypothetical protein
VADGAAAYLSSRNSANEWYFYHHGCPKQFQLALVRFVFRSEAEEGAFRRRWASCKEAEAATPQAY